MACSRLTLSSSPCRQSEYFQTFAFASVFDFFQIELNHSGPNVSPANVDCEHGVKCFEHPNWSEMDGT